MCVRGKRLAPLLQGEKVSLPRPPPVTQPTRPGSSGDQFILKRRRYRRRLDSGRGGQRRASTFLLDPPVGVCAALTNARCRFCAAVYGDAYGWREVALTSVASQSINQSVSQATERSVKCVTHAHFEVNCAQVGS